MPPRLRMRSVAPEPIGLATAMATRRGGRRVRPTRAQAAVSRVDWDVAVLANGSVIGRRVKERG